MITKVSSHRKANVVYWFDNGNNVRIVFGPGSYSENYEVGYEARLDSNLESETVEIHVTGDAFIRWMDRRYAGPGAYGIYSYIPVCEIPLILKRADSRQYVTKEV